MTQDQTSGRTRAATAKTTAKKAAGTSTSKAKSATTAKTTKAAPVKRTPKDPHKETISRAFGVKDRTKHAAGSSDATEVLAALSRQMLVEQRARRRWGIFFKLATLALIVSVVATVFTSDYDYYTMPGEMAETSYDAPFVAVVEIKGLISDGANVNSNTVITNLREAMETVNSKAVILDINSPGGSPVQSASIYRELLRLRSKYPDKQVYAVISDLGASGAYYIASGADYIYADSSSIVGSIGVVMEGFGFTEIMQNFGIERRLLTAGKNKAILDPFSPRDYAGERHIQLLLDQIHQQFINDVLNNRPQLAQQDSQVFSGLIYDGRTALQLNLIDGLGDIFSVSRDEIGVEELIVIDVHQEKWLSLLERFAVHFGNSIGNAIGSAVAPSGSITSQTR